MKVLVRCMLLMSLLVSCTDADDTGDLFGQWQVTEVRDGESTVQESRNLFLQFQGENVFARVADQETYQNTVVQGVFQEMPDSLVLRFFVDEAWKHQCIENQYMMQGDVGNLRFSMQKVSGKVILRQGIRQWLLRKF